MHGMRALTLFYACFVLSISGVAHAEPPSSKITSTYRSEAGSTGFDTSSPFVMQRTMSLDASTGSYSNNVTGRFGFDRIETDYSRYIIRDRAGNGTPLSKTFAEPEHLMRAG